jgi:regulatory protein
MKITSIRQQVKNPERANIFINSKYSFSLSLNELVAQKLKIGQNIDESDQKRLKKLSEDGKLKTRSLEWVMNRPRSTREFKNYLYRKKASPEQSESLIEVFTNRGYLSDAKYAKWLIEIRRRGGKSERAIRSELSGKGVDREVADEALKDGSDERSRLKDVITKKQKLPRYKADPQKLMQYLARQGFTYDDIKSVMNKIG